MRTNRKNSHQTIVSQLLIHYNHETLLMYTSDTFQRLSPLVFKVAFFFFVLSATSLSRAESPSWAASNLALTDEVIIPGYEQLVKSSEQLLAQTDAFCKQPDEEQLKTTQKSFHQLMDAWQQVQFLRTGPAETFMRHFRIQMWPDRSNAGAKQLSLLLKEKKSDALDDQKFMRASTAVQGLPAMERLLFSKGITATSFKAEDKANYRCQLLKAMSLNLNSISNDLLKDWKEYKKSIISPAEDNDYFESHQEVSSQFLKELATQLQAVVDQKLNRPLGKRFRYKRAESWRSERSLRNITLNLESAEKQYLVAFAPHVSNEALRKRIASEFRKAIKSGQQLAMSLREAQQKESDCLTAWRKQISDLKKSVTIDLPEALDMPLGFNSLDGD